MSKIILGDTAISATEPSGPERRRFFGRKKKQRPPITHCENCGAELNGRYCGICGQPAIDYRRSFGHVLLDVLNEFLNWDSKFFATIALLFAKPWRLTNSFLAGHRVRYVHPLRLYLLASILFFFAITWMVKSAKIDPVHFSNEQRNEIKSDLERENVPAETVAKVDELLERGFFSPEKRAQIEEQLKRDDLKEKERKRLEKKLEIGNEVAANIQEQMKDLSPEIQSKVEKAMQEAAKKHPNAPVQIGDSKEPKNDFEKWIESRAKEKFGESGSKTQIFVVTLISNLPYMVLACIPLFAFVLKILYIRKKIFYIDHLIYALHIHTFAYIAIMSIVLITIGLNRWMPGALAGWIIAALWVTFAIQVFLSIRRVYRQGWFFSIFKFLLGGFVYLIVILFALATTFFITIALPS